jgi:hypothetical protein
LDTALWDRLQLQGTAGYDTFAICGAFGGIGNAILFIVAREVSGGLLFFSLLSLFPLFLYGRMLSK